MPNLHGGKSFKKAKKSTETSQKFESKGEGQDYARITKSLGNRRMLCFCNDGTERIGKLRGGICKGSNKQIIREGDIVLVSFRDFLKESENELDNMCDILSKYDKSDWRDIRTEKGINKNLFAEAEEDYFEDEEKVEEEHDEEINMDDL
jgi:translation initiation factor 1A